MKAVVKELGGSLGQLLGQQRAGVVAAMVAAAQRTGACQDALCAELAAALRSRAETGQVSGRCCFQKGGKGQLLRLLLDQ